MSGSILLGRIYVDYQLWLDRVKALDINYKLADSEKNHYKRNQLNKVQMWVSKFGLDNPLV